MSNNFWDEQLSGDDPKNEADKSSRKRIDSTEHNVNINVTLDDFPVNNWDSDNDGQEIVHWYNDNRMAEDEKTLDFFKSGSGVRSIYSRSQAQKLLDFTIHTLEQEGCTVWNKPQETIEIHPGASIIGLLGGWTFAGIWCTASFVALFFVGGPVLADIGTSDWNATDGVILESGVDTSSDGEGGTTYCLWIEYQYTYDNETYDGDVLSFSKDNSCSSWSEDADEDYPAGKEITVYVNPDNPYDAVLETGISGVDFVVCFILPFPLIGIVLFVSMLRSTFGVVSSFFNVHQ
tara:strand:+ start:6327 stop:7196 length:870 start_codon:yes stop_codon:yes gene_type:complete